MPTQFFSQLMCLVHSQLICQFLSQFQSQFQAHHYLPPLGPPPPLPSTPLPLLTPLMMLRERTAASRKPHPSSCSLRGSFACCLVLIVGVLVVSIQLWPRAGGLADVEAEDPPPAAADGEDGVAAHLVKGGEYATLFGKGGPSLQEAADSLETALSDLTCDLTRRVPRRYVELPDGWTPPSRYYFPTPSPVPATEGAPRPTPASS